MFSARTIATGVAGVAAPSVQLTATGGDTNWLALADTPEYAQSDTNW